MFFAQQADPNLLSILERLGSGEVFALTSILLTGTITALVMIVWIVFHSISSTKRVQTRASFVKSLVEQGMDPEDVIRIAERTLGSNESMISRCRRRSDVAEISVPAAKPIHRPNSAMHAQT